MADKQVMLIAVDDSEYSYYALDWTLNHFFKSGSSPNFKLIVVHAKIPVTSALGLAGPGTTDVMPLVEADLRRKAEKVVAKAKDTCNKKEVSDAQFEVIEGDPRTVMCEAAEKYHASVLILGSHGYGALKRVVLGSVSDYCAHHAHCSVMIVKKPKQKH